jgi:MFS family permease
MLMLSKIERENFYHLYVEILWYGLLNGTLISFIGVYAARLGATSFQVGFLTSGPGLVNLFLSLPAVYLLGKSYPERATFLSAVLNRAIVLLVIFIPWVGTTTLQIPLIMIIVIISAIPGTAMTIAANLMLVDVIPMEWRATVIGRRNALLSISTVVSLLISGVILDQVRFPLNYQIVFGIGLIGGVLSGYHLNQIISDRRLRDAALYSNIRKSLIIKAVEWINSGLQYLKVHSIRKIDLKTMVKFDLLRGKFGSFIAAYLFCYLILALPIPIYTLFLVRTLHVSDGVISIGNAIFYIMVVIFSLLLDRLTRWLGHHRILVISVFVYIFYPLIGGLAQGPIGFYIASIFGGAAWGMVGGALISRLFERSPEDDLPASMAFHNLALNIGTLTGVFIGSGLADWLGLRTSLIFSGALRLLPVLVLAIWA